MRETLIEQALWEIYGRVKGSFPAGLTFKLSQERHAESQSAGVCTQEPSPAKDGGLGTGLLCGRTGDVINLPGRQYSHLKNERAVWALSRAL